MRSLIKKGPMMRRGYLFLALAFAARLLITQPLQAGGELKTEYVVLVTIDGLRNEELFGGADPKLLNNSKRSGAENSARLKKQYWRETPKLRREALLPFFWGTLAKQGVVLGNRALGSDVEVSNPHHFSYPGYAEIMTGQPQASIKSNKAVPSPRETVLEYVGRKFKLPREKVAAICSWSVFNSITAKVEGSIFCNAGFEAVPEKYLTPGMMAANEAQFRLTTPWDTVRHDWVTLTIANEYLKSQQPKFFYVALAETDDWGHERRYDRVLQAANYFDESLRTLWATLQGSPMYRGKTSLVILTDHGRGHTVDDWVSHSARITGSAEIWIAVVGPDTPNRGEEGSKGTFSQSQVAATILRLYGLDYRDFNSDCARPIGAAFR